jgi:hypothetical protein
MDICNFKNVMKIIEDYTSEGNRLNQVDFVCSLFNFFVLQNENFVFDNGRVCRWLKGTAPISPKITRFYMRSNNAKHLCEDVNNYILPMLYDVSMVINKLFLLIVNDETISEEKKTELLKNYDSKEEFVTDVLLFALERKFIKSV